MDEYKVVFGAPNPRGTIYEIYHNDEVVREELPRGLSDFLNYVGKRGAKLSTRTGVQLENVVISGENLNEILRERK